MRFLRRRSEFVVLAMLALAAQILLSFGHSHAGHAGDRIAASQCRAFLPPAAEQPCVPHHDDDNGCAICWMMGVAGAAVLGAPPAIPVPMLVGGSLSLARQDLSLPSDAAAAFQARGPPLSLPA